MEEYIGKYFNQVNDPRSIRNQRYNFITLIGTSLLAMLSGVDSFSEMQDYTESHKLEIQKYFNLQNGIPSHDTYQRFWDNVTSHRIFKFISNIY